MKLSEGRAKRVAVKNAPGIYRRGDAFDAVVEGPRDPVTGARGKKIWKSFETRKAAEAWRDKQRVDIRNGVGVVTSERVTVGQLFERWLESKKPRLASTTHNKDVTRVALHITPHVGNVLVREFTFTTATSLYAKLQTTGLRKGKSAGKAGLSETTVHKVHVLLKGAFKWARKARLIASNPLDELEASDVPQDRSAGKKTAYSDDEVGALFDAMRGERIDDAATLAVYTGMRRGEIAALRWEHVDFDGGRLTVRESIAQIGDRIETKETKGKRSRSIPIEPEIRTVLERRRLAYRKDKLQWGTPKFVDAGYVFADELGGMYEPDAITQDFRTLARRAGVHKCFHELRHTAGTNFMRSGDVVTASEILGHAKPSTTTDIYGHANDQTKRASMASASSKVTAARAARGA